MDLIAPQLKLSPNRSRPAAFLDDPGEAFPIPPAGIFAFGEADGVEDGYDGRRRALLRNASQHGDTELLDLRKAIGQCGEGIDSGSAAFPTSGDGERVFALKPRRRDNGTGHFVWGSAIAVRGRRSCLIVQ